MNHYTATYAAPGETSALAEFDATHFSISGSNTATFWRRGTQPDSRERKDELVGSILAPLKVALDEKTAVVEGIVEDLSEEMAEAIMKALDLDDLPEDVKVRVAVTLL